MAPAKILVVTALGAGKEYCLSFLPGVLASLTGAADRLVYLDGINLTDDQRQSLEAVGKVETLPEWTETNDAFRWGRIARMREAARQACLAGGYTHLFFLDCDVIPPPDILPRLLAVQSPVASGIYLLRGNRAPILPMLDLPTGSGMTSEALKTAKDRTVCDGFGMGCMLIDHAALEKTPFRGGEYWAALDYKTPGAAAYGEDWQWNLDSDTRPVLDLGVSCWHVAQNGFANRLFVGELRLCVIYVGNSWEGYNRCGRFEKDVPRFDLTEEQMASLDTNFVREERRELTVEIGNINDLLPTYASKPVSTRKPKGGKNV